VFNIQEELKKLPEKPGVYIMKDRKGNVIYVGKAVVLKNRVRQYFQSSVNQSPKTQVLVSNIAEFEYIVTDNELEALILECNLIKKYRPRYNILLKDDKTYPYIKVTMNEEYPRILITRRLEKDGARYFGPYTNVKAVRETISLLKKLFPIKTCTKVLPRDIGKSRPCLNYYIHQCLGPCQGNVDKDEYRKLMKDICSFLNGKHEDVVKRLEQQMIEAAENMEFEKAASLRDKINSLRHISEEQKVVSTTAEDQDVIGFAKDSTDACVQVFFVRGGKLIGREHFIFQGAGDDDAKDLLSSFVKQFYSSASYIPGEILLQEEIDENEVIESWLSGKREGRVHIRVPKRGEKHHLIEMVAENAEIALKQFKEKVRNQESYIEEAMEGLTECLGLDKPPRRIEAYDISNTGTSEVVASMVVFEEGLPNKSEYRKFRIKTVGVQNDYAAMQEVLYRRFRSSDGTDGGEDQKKGKRKARKKYSSSPDLILVDGGLGHVNASKEVLDALNIGIPVAGMVKDENHKTRGLVSEYGEKDISKNIPVLRLVTTIQDEAHRFALEYNRKLREKRYRGSVLDNIEGVGPKRKKALIRHFGSISRIREAEIEDLMAVEGIPRNVAENIYYYFRQ